MSPKISVIIPTYNRAHTLPRAIDSVLAQDYPFFDLWVVDDGSVDETHKILEAYAKEQKVNIIMTENSGVSAARNLGVQSSKGEWVSFLDSDDEWLAHKLSAQVALLKENPSLKLIHGEEIWIRKGKRVNQRKIHQKSGGDIFLRSLDLCLISPSAVLLSRELFNQMGGFDEEFVVCEDYDLWLKITSLYPVGFVTDPILKKYGGHDDQLSQKFVGMDYWRVKAMKHLLDVRELQEEREKYVLDAIIKKGEILLKGYKKHHNMQHFQEIQEIVSHAYGIKEKER